MGRKLKREVACLACGTVQDADNEFCDKCKCNLYKTLSCEQCEHGPKAKNDHKLRNIKGRCFNFTQINFKQFKDRVRASEGLTKIE